ncbi:L-methionine/branched-chain amino acid transporter [Hahella sp. CCB-MM4]|uniref:L-methionine/branched-chain amino acid transporter n=1 Tax=Hahella sp. (strain CCB-MM4) TaxID=1926491 RepID=UPI000B9A491D|nr:L-methionine/branched-chain amino acid transporter [Hahella sp. CCB-MM4]OZG73127.1 L-methionine/branched-chain amino acid transporter [Hahella sp. CCB-MM4]
MNELKPTLTLVQGLGLLTSALLGTGVFMLPELTVRTSGGNALWGWMVLILAILPVALSFGQLGRRFPHAGGASHFVELAFGKLQGRIVGWLFLALLPVGLPAAMEMAVWFLGSLVSMSDAQQVMAKVLLLLMMMAVNLRGIKLSGAIQTTISVTVCSVIFLLTWLAIDDSGPTAATRYNPFTADSLEMGAVAAAAALAFWSFIGVEALAHVSSEFKNPQRDFPLALIIGVLIVGLVYSLGTWLVLSYPGSLSPDTPAMVILFDKLIGPWGGLCIGLFGFLSCVATMNIYHASASRMLWSLARGGDAPRMLEKLNRQQAPVNSVIAMTVVCLISLLISSSLNMSLEGLIMLSNGIVVLIYIMTMMAAIRLLSRWRKLLAAGGMLICVWLAVTLAASMLYAGVLYVSLWIWFRSRYLGEADLMGNGV